MGVEIKEVKPAVQNPVESIVWDFASGTRQLTFRHDSQGSKRVTVQFDRWTTQSAKLRGTVPTSTVKGSVFPNEIRELANALVRLADSIDAK